MISSTRLSSKSPTVRRILREATEISNNPSPDYAAEPLETDMFEWHFTLRGPPLSVYSEGVYHGRIILPPTYPLRPPSFRFATPNGRFEVNREICLSISGHHEETWQPAWGIRTALVALRSFMETDAKGQLGGLETTDKIRQSLAKSSALFKCPICVLSNADIIDKSRERSKQVLSPPEDIKIPKNLSMSWKDPLVTTPAGQIHGEGYVGDSGAANDVEGMVQRSQTDANNDSPPQLPSHDITAYQRHSDDEDVPLWLDRAIVGLLILLAALLLKILFGV